MSESKEALLLSVDGSETLSSPTSAAAGTPAAGMMPRRTPPPLSLPALNALRSRRVILASQSPRRRQLMSYLGLTNLEVIPSNAAEDLPKSMAPFEYALATAVKKAQAVYAAEVAKADKAGKGAEEPALVLAADTIVVDVASGAIFEKPRSEAHHLAMLRQLRDMRSHRVYTAVAAMAPLASAREPGYVLETAIEETAVQFDGDVTDDLIMAYVRTREGADKAGGYGLQGLGSILIEKIDGSYDNVIGLPLKTTLKLIEKVMAKADDDDDDDGNLLCGGDLSDAEDS